MDGEKGRTLDTPPQLTAVKGFLPSYGYQSKEEEEEEEEALLPSCGHQSFSQVQFWISLKLKPQGTGGGGGGGGRGGGGGWVWGPWGGP